jgi:glyoxylase I family protein
MPDRHTDGNRFTHIGICVSDLERSIAFYRDVLGFTEVARRLNVTDAGSANLLDFPQMDVELVYLERDGIRIELLGYRVPEPQALDDRRPMNLVGLTHLAFRVSDLDDLCRRIELGGGTVLPSTTATFEQGNRGVMTLDPDGVRVELIERPNA